MTYVELARCARAVAMRTLGELEPGDRLAIWSANNPEWIIAQLATALAGVVLVPMNPALTDHEASFMSHLAAQRRCSPVRHGVAATLLRKRRASGRTTTPQFRCTSSLSEWRLAATLSMM
jgi:acyl-CoA synthetase (AMP-forming)/AMP-acid ligase II